MSKKNTPPPSPEEPVVPEPVLQITPVDFSPTAKDAIGTVKSGDRWPDFQYPVFIPMLIILLTLNGSTIRDIVALNKRMNAITAENEQPLKMLADSAKQLQFRDNLRSSIQTLALTDPVAADIAKDFFPKPNSVPKSNFPDMGNAPSPDNK